LAKTFSKKEMGEQVHSKPFSINRSSQGDRLERKSKTRFVSRNLLVGKKSFEN
jgi:hypothetical protein